MAQRPASFLGARDTLYEVLNRLASAEGVGLRIEIDFAKNAIVMGLHYRGETHVSDLLSRHEMEEKRDFPVLVIDRFKDAMEAVKGPSRLLLSDHADEYDETMRAQDLMDNLMENADETTKS